MADKLIKYAKEWHILMTSIVHSGIAGRATNDFAELNFKEIDIILWLPDWRIDLLRDLKNLDSKKLILAIRCNVFKKDERTLKFYSDGNNLRKICAGIACANLSLKQRFKKLHPNVYYMPGGVDTDIFRPINRNWHNPPIVGWAGSEKNFGREARGLDLIQSACDSMKLEFKPILREHKWYSESEMVKYYQDEIDIYVDAHDHAGRQNGLLEAGACGKTIVATRAGISEELILSGVNGFLCNRTVERIKGALFQSITADHDKISRNIREDIERKWSWKMHARYFEEMFNDVIRD
jgi:hypothetical protein